MGPNEKDLPATCDGLDDDCDGTVKGGKPGEMANVGEACETGVGECKGPGVFVCEPGEQTCVNGKWSDCAGEKSGTAEKCDGADNDCNGIDDDLTDGTVNDLCSIIRESCDDVDGDTCDNCPNDEEGK